MTHGNQLGPRCVHCDRPIHHTAPGGHWTHTHTSAQACSTADTTATPHTIP